MRPLDRLRLQLTGWYAGTFSLILLLLGGGLFLVIRGQIARQLDGALGKAVAELKRAAAIREVESVGARGAVVDAVDELHIPDRQLFLLDGDARPVKPPAADAWVQDAARAALGAGAVDRTVSLPGERTLRLHAERFTLRGRTTYVGVAVADQVELEDEYAALIGAFGAAAAFGLMMVAAGGYVLVRKSTEPVERTMAHMRRFMADAAHELRTPLTVVRTRAEVALQRDRSGPEYVEALRGVSSEAARLGGIVEELLTLARADAGERPLRRETVYLDDLALDAADAARVVAERQGVSVEMETFEEAAVTGDASLLRQLLETVLDNAVKFTPAGGRVRVGVSAPDGRPTVTVEDTGVGIPPDQLPHVFDRFYRGDAARGRSDGAGLGLAIARWIADAHGAEIAVDSQVGRGTRVTIRFPVLLSSS